MSFTWACILRRGREGEGREGWKEVVKSAYDQREVTPCPPFPPSLPPSLPSFLRSSMTTYLFCSSRYFRGVMS